MTTNNGNNLSRTITNLTPVLGTGSLVLTTAPTITSQVMPGQSTNVAVSSGNVGEVLIAQVLYSSAITITSNIVADITSLSITAGDWDIFGNFTVENTGGSYLSTCLGWLSSTSATQPDNSVCSGAIYTINVCPKQSCGVMPIMVSLSTTTIYYLSTLSIQVAGALAAAGTIYAIRRR